MKAIHTTLLGAALSLSTVAGVHLHLLEGEAQAEAARRSTVRFDIGGMITQDCPERVKKALANVKGVLSVSASLEDKSATVRFDSSKTDADAIAARIEAATPFTATVSR